MTGGCYPARAGWGFKSLLQSTNTHSKYYLYILYSESLNSYYTGITNNPVQRLEYHNRQNKGWSRRGRPWILVFQKEFNSKSEAIYWERWIKKQKNRSLIEKIIANTFKWM